MTTFLLLGVETLEQLVGSKPGKSAEEISHKLTLGLVNLKKRDVT
jgi:hypothetical protein